MKIMKFGGKSLGSLKKVQKICKYIKKIYENDKKIIITVSAMGFTTDGLLGQANILSCQNPNIRELAKLLSCGEEISSTLVSICLNALGVPAKSFDARELKIKTHGGYQDALIYSINKKPLQKCLDSETVAIVTGFQGTNYKNEITTLGRGGSDTTACAIGAVFDCTVEIYSDFNGVCAGDPQILNYKKLNNVNYSAAAQISKLGAKVLAERSIDIAKKYNIKVLAKQSSKPRLAGTQISGIESNYIFVTVQKNLCQIFITFSKIQKQFIVKNVLKCLNKVNYYNFSIDAEKISFLINQADFDKLNKLISSELKIIKPYE